MITNSLKWLKSTCAICVVLSISTTAIAQVSGVKTIPADYASINAFVTDINTNGIGAGGVTLNIPAGYTETAPTGGINVTATGTASDPIIIQKSGVGSNPVITAYTGGTGTPGSATCDGILSFTGSDYVTIDGIDLMENAANTSNPSTMEYGLAFFKSGPTDGCQNNTIRNCVIQLSRLNNASGTGPNVDGSKGIWFSNSTRTSSATNITVSAASGANSNNVIYANTIDNVNIGIAMIGYAASSPYTSADQGNDIGGASLATGNTIINFGGATGASNPAVGIRTLAQYGFNCSYNTINNNTGSGINHVSTLRGIYTNTAANASSAIEHNAITLQSGATTSSLIAIDNASGGSTSPSTVNINFNNIQMGYGSATSGTATGINNSSSVNMLNINNNIIEGIALTTLGGTGTNPLIETGSPTTVNVNNNTLRNFQRDGASGTIRGIKLTSPATAIISGNTIQNLEWTTLASTGSIDGIYGLSSAVSVTITNNTIHNLLTPSTGSITGIREWGSAGNKTVTGNTIYGFATTTGGAGGSTFNGIFLSVGTMTISGNTVHSLNSSGTTGGTGGAVYGIQISGGTGFSVSQNKVYNLSSTSTGPVVAGIFASSSVGSISNNLISDLRSTAGSGANIVRGITFTTTSTGTLGVYHNTIYLSAVSSGADFGTSGIFHTSSATATSGSLDLRNNIIINNSTANGTGLTVALRRSGVPLNNFNTSSNKNLLFSGTPSATNLIYYDGTTAQQTLANYMTAVAPRELQSITGEAFSYATPGSFFTSLTGATADFLKPVAGISSQVESGASPITTPVSVSADYAGVTRATFGGYAGTGVNPDMGAFEFEGTSPTPVITLNSVTPPTSAQCVASGRLISVDITTTAGTIVSANIGYAINGAPQAPIAMVNTSGSTWEATIPAASPANATISWGVSATNSLALNGTYAGAAYADEPLFSATPSISTSVAGDACAGDDNVLTAVIANGQKTIGAGTLATTSSAGSSTNYVSPFTYYYGGYKAQYVVLASELTAAGVYAGQLTSVAFDLTSSANVTHQGLNISIAPTANTVASATFIAGTFTDVYSGNLTVSGTGLFTIPFSTPFNWDGTSNIVVQLCWSNNNTGGSSTAEVRYDPTPFTAMAYFRADSQLPAALCGATTATGTQSNRPKMVFGTTIATTSVSWSDGSTTVGTTNPVTVTPSATTTYTATIVAAGCPVTPAPSTTITVNPLPSMPTATNSAQCGTQLATASVTSTSGLPTPTFVWYDAATGGTALQTGTETTYQSVIASTTTFHVAELNTTTGCESARVAVTVSVSSADPVSATPGSLSICLGDAVTLTAANTNPTPVQSYTYTWISTTGSGNETTIAGTSVSVTPTALGTYTYDLTAVDGGCTSVASTSVTINPIPTALSAGASDNDICLGDAVNLLATVTSNSQTGPATVLSQNFDAGMGSWTTEYSGTASAATGWTTQNAPYSYSTYFTNFATPQAGGFAMSNADLGATGLKTRAKLISPSFSTVGMLNATLTFENLYRRWTSGDSLVRVEISADGGTTWGTLVNYTTSQGVTTDGAQVPANASIPLPAMYLNQSNVKIRFNYVSTWGYYWIIDNVAVSGTGAMATDFSWSSVPAGFTSTAQNPTGLTPTVTTDYTVLVTNSYGCSASATTNIVVNNLPTVDAGTSQTVCSGTSVTLSGSGAASYVWNNGVTDNTPFSAVTTNTYTVTGTDANGCSNTDNVLVTVNALPVVDGGADQTVCAGDLVTLSATGAPGYTWDNGITNNVAFTPSATQTYTVTGTDANGCTGTDAVLVTVNTLPTVNAGADQATCIGSAITLSGSGASSYVWDNGVTDNTPFTATASQTYTVTGTDANGCSGTDAVDITVNALPTVDAGSDQTVCEGDMVTVTGSGASSYAWNNGVTDNTPFAATTSTTYTVTGTDANGCTNTDMVDVTVNTLPAVSAGVDQTVCEGSMVTLTGSGASTYSWDNGITDNTPFSATATATYTVIGTDANGCVNSDDVTVNVDSNPVATATDNGDATITAGTAASYQWIDCATNQPIPNATAQTFAPTQNGNYAVTVTNSAGCSATSSCVFIGNVGIKEITDNTVSVYPNPTAGDVTIVLSAGTAEVEVIDAQGKAIALSTVQSGEKISLSGYNRGVYILRVATERGTSLHRIVKN